ncbi:MAG: FAD:protein FMN transferase [Patescibacteria group bacterium]
MAEKKVFFTEFKAMGTDIFAAINCGDKKYAELEFENIKSEISVFENRFSRFKKDSELSKLNKSAGGFFQASDEMIELLLCAKEAYEITNGIFDPAVLPILEKIGYNQDFDKIKEGIKKISKKQIQKDFSNLPKFEDIVIDNRNKIVKLPQGVKIDLGGIAKGFIIDRIVMRLRNKFENFWISAGGDMYLFGRDSENKNWQVGVQNPLEHSQDILFLNIPTRGAAAATSGITKRKGKSGNFVWHHLIDPRTGLPADNDILAATVIADSVWQADVLAKTALILGKKEGIDFLGEIPNAGGLLIDENLEILFSKGIKDYVIEK